VKPGEWTGPEVKEPADIDPREFLAVVDEAERCFASATTGHWMGVLRAIGYPCSRYNRPDEAIEDPQVVANDLVVGLDHPVFGHYVTTGMPLRIG
jgi:crotonobetainyl-CoA:carnitine CoA-transferase CaiB-like acyl-CoA transferase